MATGIDSNEQILLDYIRNNIILEAPGLWDEIFFMERLRNIFLNYEFTYDQISVFKDGFEDIKKLYMGGCDEIGELYNIYPTDPQFPEKFRIEMRDQWISIGEKANLETGTKLENDILNPYIQFGSNDSDRIYLFDRFPAPSIIRKILDPKGITKDGVRIEYLIKTMASVVGMDDGSTVEDAISTLKNQQPVPSDSGAKLYVGGTEKPDGIKAWDLWLKEVE